VLESDAFGRGHVHTRWADEALPQLTLAPSEELLAAARQAAQTVPTHLAKGTGQAPDPWASLPRWRA
jgi:hypothetical protein